MGGRLSRIQFTPDLLPSDVTGVTVYDQTSGDFTFHPGPIFHSLVLAALVGLVVVLMAYVPPFTLLVP